MKTFTRALCLAVLASSAALASNFSFTGDFGTDDAVQLFLLTISAPTTVTFQSIAYGGGNNAVGAVIPPGGFDTYFNLFAPDGTPVGQNDDSSCVGTHSYLGACLDAYFQDVIGPGTYTLALTESGNFSLGNLGDGFSQAGNGNFSCPQGFCDVFQNQEDGHWAVDILGVDRAIQEGGQTAPGTPEPMTFLLTGSGLGLLGLAQRRRLLLLRK